MNAPTHWLVVINYQGETTVATPFTEEADARDFFDRASAQWSDAFLCRVVVGPGVREAASPHPAGGDEGREEERR